MSSPPHIEVTELPKRFPPSTLDGGRPSHHLNDTKTLFGNPWPSFRYATTFCVLCPWLTPVVLSLDSSRPSNGSPYVPFCLASAERCLISSCAFQFFSGFFTRSPRVPKDIKSLIPKQTPTWGAQHGNGSSGKATWLRYVPVTMAPDDT